MKVIFIKRSVLKKATWTVACAAVLLIVLKLTGVI